MKTPLLIVNFKTYARATGEKALELAKLCDKIASKENIEIGIAVQAVDLKEISNSVSIPVLAQHIDAIEPGAHTGWVLAETLKEAGASGSLINHSEHKIGFSLMERAIERAHQNNLEIVACAASTEEAKKIASFEEKPEFIAVEPPELIGGNISVSSAKPELIKSTVEEVKKIADIKVLAGAGVKNKEDVKKSIELGAQGVLVASGVVNAENQQQAIIDLVDGVK